MTDLVSFLTEDTTHGLGSLEIHHPPGTFALTPASLIAVEAISRHRSRFHGVGLDWGSGSGVLSLTAARIPAVESVLGLELEGANVAIATENARRNALSHKAAFYRSDSYSPFDPDGQSALGALVGNVDFIIANPPSSSPLDDGFGFRRAVIRGSAQYLKPGGLICLSVSWQYGIPRIMGLLDLDPSLEYAGVLASTDWVPFDMDREDLSRDLRSYAAEEARGGLPYAFRRPGDRGGQMCAIEALAHHERSAQSPESRWQSHLFARRS